MGERGIEPWPADQVRSRQVQTRFTESEFAVIKSHCERIGITPAVLMRQLMLDKLKADGVKVPKRKVVE